MIFSSIQNALDTMQPAEQHGFRQGYKLEEHLVTANIEIDRFLAVGVLVWVVSLALSKTFDRVNWVQLWHAPTTIQQHMVFRGTWFGLFNVCTGNKLGVFKVGRVIAMHLPSVPA